VLNSVLEYQLPSAEAAEVMGVSQHHTKRLLAQIHRRDAVGPVRRGMKVMGRAGRALIPTDWDRR